MKKTVMVGVIASTVFYLRLSLAGGDEDEAAKAEKEATVAESMQQAKAKAEAVEANLAAAEATRRGQFEDL